jgi:hypothetical protein
VVIKKEKKNYHHVVVMDRSTLLEEHGDRESNVLSSSMEIRLIPSFEPIGNFCNIKKLFFLRSPGGGSPPEFYWIKLHKAAVKKTFTRFTPLKSNLQNTYCNIKKLLLLQVTGKLFRKKQYHIASRREKEEQS